MQAFPKIPNTTLFLAGGYVRDTLLGLEPKDRDFVAITEMTFDEFVDAVNTVGKVFQSRPEYLTVRARIEGESIDLVFPRTEHVYTDQRHPDEVNRIFGPIKERLQIDASRRDFTINSMFMDEEGNLLDFFDGEFDLHSRIIRAVGNPSDRFKEDPLRILRGIRFASRFCFQIDPITELHMSINAPLIRTVAVERIREELNGAMKANPMDAVKWISNLGLFADIVEKGLTFQVTMKGN